MAMILRSVQVGRPQTYGTEDAEDPMDRPWTTAFFKEPVAGAVALGPEGLDGDGQADRSVHGGPDKAVNVYAQDHYAYWEAELGHPLPPGAFGENFTTQGLVEDAVCIGDVMALGTVRVQVSQPRQPCWKLARRWRVKDLTARVVRSGLTGWYFRVLETGAVEAPATFELLERPHPEWTVAKANAIMHFKAGGAEAAAALAACPALSASWQHQLSKRAL